MNSQCGFTIGASAIQKVLTQLELMLHGGFNNNPKMLFLVNDEGIIAKATNGEAYIEVGFDCEEKSIGSFVVSGEMFVKIVKDSNKMVSFFKNEEHKVLSIKIDDVYNYEIALAEIDESYFNPPKIEEVKTFTMQAQDFKTAISSVICCIDQVKSPHLAGVMVHSQPDINKKVFIVATDAMRLGICEREATFDAPIPNLMIPKKTAEDILVVIGENNGSIDISYCENSIKILAGSTMYMSRLLDVSFPKYQSVVPTQNNKVLEVKKESLRVAIERTTRIAEQTSKIQLSISADKVLISFTNENGETSRCEIEATYSDNEQINIICKYEYLLEILKKIPSELVRFQIFDSATPMLIKNVDDDLMKYVFMPLVY